MRALLIFVCVVMASYGCGLFPGEPGEGRELGMTVEGDGAIAVLYNPCGPTRIAAIRLVDQIGSVFGDEDDRVLWEVRATEPILVDEVFSFTLGITPDGFDEVVPLRLPFAGRLGLEVHTDDLTASEVFEVEELREGRYRNHRGDYLTEEHFRQLDPCEG